MKIRLLGGIAAILVALIGTVLLINYVQNADTRALANTETQDVYVVQKSIPAGTAANNFGDAVLRKPISKAVLAEGAVGSLSDLGTKVTSVALVPGETLLESRMTDPATLATPDRAPVPAGLQEVTIKLPVERVAGGNLRAGDTVGMALSFSADDKAQTSAQTQLTLQDVLVTAVQYSSGATAETDSKQASTNTTAVKSPAQSQAGGEYLVTVARSALDVEKIVHTVEFGSIYLSKESADSADSTVGSVDRTKVFR